MKKPNKKAKTLIARAAEINAHLAEVKPLYRELDAITEELVAMEVMHAFQEGYQMTIVDNFADKNTTFRVARFKRYDLKIEVRYVPVKKATKATKGEEVFPTKKKKKA